MSNTSYWKNRGNPWEYDKGPPKNLSWARLFSETPNYRQLSREGLGSEKFRWHFGPMYYRGRLKPNSVKVLVIGQEGAQDESIAHRSFVGGTGARMQYFVRFIGIDYAYLFVNTFVYPIYGQYSSNIKWLAQNLESPIVKQRHEIFNYILKKNDVRLIVAVGTAAKESVRTWVESRDGTCPDGTRDLSTCTGSDLDPKTRIVGVLHPGGASKGGAIGAIKRSFNAAIRNIRNWVDVDPLWLPVDKGMRRDLSKPYTYSKAPIPFRDLPFGINWRIGRGSTSSNRKDRQKSIQLFSAGGKYGNKGDKIFYSDMAPGHKEGYLEGTGDVPYEPPVSRYRNYDKGPGSTFSKLFMGAKTGFEWPDFNSLGVEAHASFGFGSIYRGRPDRATALILADQQSQDDLFTARAFTGDAGQRFQAYLSAIGLSKSYCILRVFPVDTQGLSLARRKSLATNEQVLRVYNRIVKKILSRKRTRLIITLGAVSGLLVDKLQTGRTSITRLKAWKEPGAKQNWKNALLIFKSKNYQKDLPNPTYAFNGEPLQIPRYDLPYGMLKWQGTSGDRARRAKLAGGRLSPDYYKIIMPDWAFVLKPLPLSAAEKKAIANHP
jgi:uracil-DNA glycosylase